MTGTYTDIVEIVAQSTAIAGARVDVTIRIKNKYSASVHVAAIGVLDSEERFIDWLDYWIPAGATHSFSGYFYMPSKSVTIHGYSYFEGTDGYWHFDDEDAKGVELSAAPEGTITRKELEYDEARASIPAYDVPQDTKGLVHIWGRNDMTEAQRMGIGWMVTDPNGAIVEQYSAWEAWPYTGAGMEHEFIGGRFPFNYGAYRIAVGLYIYPDGTNPVDTYSGILCTVKPELVSEFSELKLSSLSKV